MKRVEAGDLTLSDYEEEARDVLAHLGRSMDTVALQRQDIDAPVLWVDGVRCRRVGRW